MSSSWKFVESDKIESAQLDALIAGDIPGIAIRSVYSASQTNEIVQKAVRERDTLRCKIATEYGPNMGIESALPIRSHWNVKYKDYTWDQYFKDKPDSEIIKAGIFSDVRDPVELAMEFLESATTRSAKYAVLPETNQGLFCGLIRPGYPKLHYDWCVEDIDGFYADSQLGWSIYLRMPQEDGQPRVFNIRQDEDSHAMNQFRGETHGNYDKDDKLAFRPELDAGEKNDFQRELDCRDCAVPHENLLAGDFLILNTEYLHDVTGCNDTPNVDSRWSVSGHVAVTSDELMFFS